MLRPVLPGGFRPFTAIIIWKLCVPGDALVYFGDKQLVSQRQGSLINLASTDDEHGVVILPATAVESGIETGKGEHFGRRGEVWILREDDVGATGQRLA